MTSKKHSKDVAMDSRQTRRQSLAVERARRRRPVRSLVVATATAMGCAVLGVAAAGGTYAFLNDTKTLPGATIQAGTMGLLVNDAATANLGTVTVNPGSPQAIPFTVTNTGDVVARFSVASSTTSTSGLKSIMRANVGVTSGSCVASDAAAGTQTIDSYASTGILDFAAGEKKNLCLYLSVPTGSDAALSGTSIPFTLTLTSQQIQ